MRTSAGRAGSKVDPGVDARIALGAARQVIARPVPSAAAPCSGEPSPGVQHPGVARAVRGSGAGVRLLRVSDVQPRLGDVVIFSGALRDAGGTVALQWRTRGGEWSTVGTTRVAAQGAFALEHQVRSTAVRWYRVMVEVRASRRRAWTKVASRSVKVVPTRLAPAAPRVPAQRGAVPPVGAVGAPVLRPEDTSPGSSGDPSGNP